jgi:hypothetical protein
VSRINPFLGLFTQKNLFLTTKIVVRHLYWATQIETFLIFDARPKCWPVYNIKSFCVNKSYEALASGSLHQI